jgi:hypothetical protein
MKLILFFKIISKREEAFIVYIIIYKKAIIVICNLFSPKVKRAKHMAGCNNMHIRFL